MSTKKKLTVESYLSPAVKYDTFGGNFIWKETELGLKMIMDINIRGWGEIQHLFDRYEEAEQFQDEVGEWIADAINQKLKSKETKTNK